MVLDPSKYLSKDEDARMLRLLQEYLADPKSEGLQQVAKRAVVIARFLSSKLRLGIKTNKYLFSPLPWTLPGDKVELTDDILRGMVEAVERM